MIGTTNFRDGTEVVGNTIQPPQRKSNNRVVIFPRYHRTPQFWNLGCALQKSTFEQFPFFVVMRRPTEVFARPSGAPDMLHILDRVRLDH